MNLESLRSLSSDDAGTAVPPRSENSSEVGYSESGAVAQTARKIPTPKRRWLFRVCLPLMVFLLSGALFAYAAREALIPAREVSVVRVALREDSLLMTQANQDKNPKVGDAQVLKKSSRVAVQAPGWLEPDPYPTYVSALANGVVEEVLVLEGDTVIKGQVVARLIREDAELSVRQAQAEVAMKTAQLTAAETNWREPVALTRQVQVTLAASHEVRAELKQLDALVQQQHARLSEFKVTYESVRDLSPDAISKLDVETARHQLEAQAAMLAATKAKRPVLEARLSRHESELKAAQRDLQLRVIDKQRVAEARAALKAAEVRQAEAELELSRMTIKSAHDGIVMNRLVSTGAKIMLDMESPYSAHVVHLYDPKRLQVRVDVPLSEAAKVGVGQRTSVIVDVLPDQVFEGEVTRFVHQADISKNTVEVKVAVRHPSPLLKPDMLARVKFYASEEKDHIASQSSDSTADVSDLSMYVPKLALINRSANRRDSGRDARFATQSEVDSGLIWTVNTQRQLELRSVTFTGHQMENQSGEIWFRVLSGVQPGDVLVVNPANDLKEGQRVTIKEMEAQS